MIRHYALAFGILSILAPCDAAEKVFKPQGSDRILNLSERGKEIDKIQKKLEDGELEGEIVCMTPFLRVTQHGVVYAANIFDTDEVPQQMRLYFRLHRIAKTNELYVYFGSPDEMFGKLKFFDRNSAVLIIDDKRYPLSYVKFYRYKQTDVRDDKLDFLATYAVQMALEEAGIKDELQWHFESLKPDVIDAFKHGKKISIELTTASGEKIMRDVKENQVPKVGVLLTYGSP